MSLLRLQNILQKSTGGLHFASSVDGEVLAHGHDVPVTNLEQFVIGIHASRKTLEVRHLDDSFILIIAKGEEGGTTLGAIT